MTKKIRDEDLVEIAGGTDGVIIDLEERMDRHNNDPNLGKANPGETGGVGGMDPKAEGGSDGIQEL